MDESGVRAQPPTAQPPTWRRLAGGTTAAAVAVAVVAEAAETLGAVVAGRVAEHPTAGLVGMLAALLVGSTLLDTAGCTAFSGVVARAEGRLRADLLHAALHQPLPVLEEQAVGEMLDRVDDDARQLGVLVRRTGWQVGHAVLRVRLSGGQVQRLALARALATEAELLVADDVSSALDARTEVELWEALRRRGVTVVGCSSKRSALERADYVVVLDDGRVAATGPWSDLSEVWGHLAG